MTPAPRDITRLLVAWNNGDEAALADLTPLVYEELHRLARRYMAASALATPYKLQRSLMKLISG